MGGASLRPRLDEDIKEAVQEAKENGEDDPVLILAPKEWIPVTSIELKNKSLAMKENSDKMKMVS